MENGVSPVAPDTFLMGVSVSYHPQYSCTYLVAGESLAVVETGPTVWAKGIPDRVHQLGYDPAQIGAVFVTHIHVDHAGGAGYLAQQPPNARVYVHERGAKHLLDPTALIAGTKGVFGEDFEATFGPILPVSQSRLHPLEDGETVDLGKGHVLEAVFTPGHAHHHLCLYDQLTRAAFTGDAAGHYYPDIDVVLPGAAPPSFDFPVALQDLQRLQAMDISTLLFSHSGASRSPTRTLQLVAARTKAFMDVVREAANGGASEHEVAERLYSFSLNSYGLPREDAFLGSLMRICELNSGGYLAYLARNGFRS